MAAQEWSKMHRLMVGDRVTVNHNGYVGDGEETLLAENEHEGVVVSFANEERSHLVVDFGEDGEHVLTEDELRRVA